MSIEPPTLILCACVIGSSPSTVLLIKSVVTNSSPWILSVHCFICAYLSVIIFSLCLFVSCKSAIFCKFCYFLLLSFFSVCLIEKRKKNCISHPLCHIQNLRISSFSHKCITFLAKKINLENTITLITILVSVCLQRKVIIKKVCASQQQQLNFYRIAKF